jgi:hypothetical protein
MFISVLKFKQESYDCYGDSTTTETVTLEANTKKQLDLKIKQTLDKYVYKQYGDFNLLMSESKLLDIKTYKSKD